eukprot:TRINITY_DN5458_c0_g1_i3.p2 TRINITY_DN5458_c0_g1~~TRINITY_DN5458_c0_g1_i3.p2  ORF type:complete len:202 (+),score=26.74 TRINITY_DN5458_c0_g1_i3:73-678(+)
MLQASGTASSAGVQFNGRCLSCVAVCGKDPHTEKPVACCLDAEEDTECYCTNAESTDLRDRTGEHRRFTDPASLVAAYRNAQRTSKAVKRAAILLARKRATVMPGCMCTAAQRRFFLARAQRKTPLRFVAWGTTNLGSSVAFLALGTLKLTLPATAGPACKTVPLNKQVSEVVRVSWAPLQRSALGGTARFIPAGVVPRRT